MKKRAVACLLAGVIVSSSRVVRPQTDFAVIPNPNCTTSGAMMCGLDNPRGLAFDASGALYVAEAGRGNASPNEPVVLRDDLHPATALPQNCTSDGAPYSCGATGAITRLQAGVQERIATGLPSGIALQNPGAGNVKLGPNAVSWLGVGRPSRRGLYVPIGLWDDPNDRAANYPSPLATGFGQIVHVNASGTWDYVHDIAAFVATLHCDMGTEAWCDAKEVARGYPDANPYSIIARPDHLTVLDASANVLLRVNNTGRASLLATFPLVLPPDTTTCTAQPTIGDAVPTSVVIGPDEAYYVGEHTGFPFYAGNAKVYRVVPGEEPTVFLRGFTTINGIAFDATGENLYVLQYFNPIACGYQRPGVVIRVHHPAQPDETRSTIVSSGLARPTSLIVGPEGALYVTTKATSAAPTTTTTTVNGKTYTKVTVAVGIGEVLRFTLPDPSSPF
jgi:hypothetical protein